MMPALVGLWCVSALFGVGLVAVAVGRTSVAVRLVYGMSLVISCIALINALLSLLAAAPPSELPLPLGLPWLGVHLRVDALAAFFLAVVNLGRAAARLYRSAED